VEQFALNHHVLLEGGRILFFALVCQENSHQQKESRLTRVAIQKIVLDLSAEQEYIYDPEVGSLRAYEEHDARFLLHLLLRGDAAPTSPKAFSGVHCDGT
jgi:hypothetical protein